jgi:uncharacterized protein (TIGR00297 family)
MRVSGRTMAVVGGSLATSGAIAGIALRRGLLSASGAAGAVVTGTVMTSAGGVHSAATLVYFFASSSALSRAFATHKQAIEQAKYAKGARRDLSQVAANGGVATALTLVSATPWGRRQRELLAAAFAGALATANADTWATEIGMLSSRPPRLITTGHIVEPGTSGGVSGLGLGATVAGALTVSGVFVMARRLVERDRGAGDAWALLVGGACGGILGSLVDSVLGAVWQAVYRCPRCGSDTERRVHHCGARTQHVRGLRWLDNDAVNALSTVAGALAGSWVWRLLRRASQLASGD